MMGTAPTSSTQAPDASMRRPTPKARYTVLLPVLPSSDSRAKQSIGVTVQGFSAYKRRTPAPSGFSVGFAKGPVQLEPQQR